MVMKIRKFDPLVKFEQKCLKILHSTCTAKILIAWDELLKYFQILFVMKAARPWD